MKHLLSQLATQKLQCPICRKQSAHRAGKRVFWGFYIYLFAMREREWVWLHFVDFSSTIKKHTCRNDNVIVSAFIPRAFLARGMCRTPYCKFPRDVIVSGNDHSAHASHARSGFGSDTTHSEQIWKYFQDTSIWIIQKTHWSHSLTIHSIQKTRRIKSLNTFKAGYSISHFTWLFNVRRGNVSKVRSEDVIKPQNEEVMCQ